jgi:hypothetical protein
MGKKIDPYPYPNRVKTRWVLAIAISSCAQCGQDIGLRVGSPWPSSLTHGLALYRCMDLVPTGLPHQAFA